MKQKTKIHMKNNQVTIESPEGRTVKIENRTLNLELFFITTNFKCLGYMDCINSEDVIPIDYFEISEDEYIFTLRHTLQTQGELVEHLINSLEAFENQLNS